MTFDANHIRSQLVPSWSGVNIALLVLLFIIAWPLGLLMIAYILWGDSLRLNLGRPESFSNAFQRVGDAFRAGMDDLTRSGPDRTNHDRANPDQTTSARTAHADTVTPADTTATSRDEAPTENTEFWQWRSAEIDRLKNERDAFEAEKAQFEADKRSAES